MPTKTNEESQSYVTQPNDFQLNQYDVVDEQPEETNYAWLDDLGWI